MALTQPVGDAEGHKVNESAVCVHFCSCIFMLQPQASAGHQDPLSLPGNP